jgi:hypothetical protein
LLQDIRPLYLSYHYLESVKFSAGETVQVVYPQQRKLLDCRILRLTAQTVDKEIGQDSLALIRTNENGKIILPGERVYYLFVLRTEKENEIQTYTGLLKTN